VARSYKDVESLIAAMAVGGAICKDVSFDYGGTVPGALSPSAECGISTVLVVFRDHASAVAYAGKQITVGKAVGIPAAEVVGPNWTVNTVPRFARKVVKAVGGQIMH
jgi:hypothetical protein